MKKDITFDSCLENIKKILLYIIERNQDIEISEEIQESEEYVDYLERLDIDFVNKFGDRYLILLNNIVFDIDVFIPVINANYILNNLNNITYVFAERCFWDSILGDVKDVLNNRFKNTTVTQYMYKNYIRHFNCNVSSNELLGYIRKELSI